MSPKTVTTSFCFHFEVLPPTVYWPRGTHLRYCLSVNLNCSSARVSFENSIEDCFGNGIYYLIKIFFFTPSARLWRDLVDIYIEIFEMCKHYFPIITSFWHTKTHKKLTWQDTSCLAQSTGWPCPWWPSLCCICQFYPCSGCIALACDTAGSKCWSFWQ